METIITDPERNYILKGLTHGTGRISKKPFSIASPAMWNKPLTDELLFYFVIVDMYVFIVIVFL